MQCVWENISTVGNDLIGPHDSFVFLSHTETMLLSFW